MVKSTHNVDPETAEKFLALREKVKKASYETFDLIDERLKILTIALKAEYRRGFLKEYEAYDCNMKLMDFLKLEIVPSGRGQPGSTITINSKAPRSPRPHETMYSADGTPLRR